MKPWIEIESGRERDAAVAEFVMGWNIERKYAYYVEGGWWVDGDEHEKGWNSLQPVYRNGDDELWMVIPEFTTSADDDYRVLEHVRREWGDEQQGVFSELLWRLLSRQAVEDFAPKYGAAFVMHPAWKPMTYRVGMFSAAAYEALRLSKGEQ